MSDSCKEIAKDITVALIQKHGISPFDSKSLKDFGEESAELYLSIYEKIKEGLTSKH